MNRTAALFLLVFTAAVIAGCGSGEVTDAQQKAKNDAIKQLAGPRPPRGRS